MIAVTPQIIFSKEAAQNRPPHFLARTSLSTRNRFTPNFQGWCLDENLKPKSSPYGGGGGAPTKTGGAKKRWGGPGGPPPPRPGPRRRPPPRFLAPPRAAARGGGHTFAPPLHPR